MERKYNSVWDFVSRHYYKYHQCGEIAYNDDLYKILDGEIEGNAEDIYNEKIEEGMTHDDVIVWALNELKESNAYIFEKAIEDFIEEHNEKLTKQN